MCNNADGGTLRKVVTPFPSTVEYIIVSETAIRRQLYCQISSSHGGEYDVQSCLLGYTAV
jgi:hypothetical protein